MEKNFLARFLVRWLVCALGLWIAAGLTDGISYGGSLLVIVIAGLVLAIVNTILKPVLILLSLSAVILSLGLFMVVINALLVLLASWLFPLLHVSGFWSALFAGIIIGLVNLLVTTIVKSREEVHK